MNNQKGFTLIELIVVIVILGILAAVAVPKFMDMQGEAKKGVLEGIRGSFKSAVTMAHAKSLLAGNPSAAVTVEGNDVEMVNGYPAATTANLADLVDLDTLDITDTPDADGFTAVADAAAKTLTVTYDSYSFVYTETASTSTPPNLTAVSP